jgi:hypothetical protein
MFPDSFSLEELRDKFEVEFGLSSTDLSSV